MKALIYRGPGQKGWETKADPAVLAPTDAIVRIDSSTISRDWGLLGCWVIGDRRRRR